MYGPYLAKIARGKKVIEYVGNKVSKPIGDVRSTEFEKAVLDARLNDIVGNKHFYHLHRIDNAVFLASVDYFKKLGAEWCNLPLTTLMISSPGEVYAGKKLDYTTDALPMELTWFDGERKVFLAESSQFYLELRLLIDKVSKVFSIYNSFRKEKADFSHLSEFQHIEFEGLVGFKENVKIATGLLRHIIKYIFKHNREDLAYFLTDVEIESLPKTFIGKNVRTITFKKALKILLEDTKDPIYKEFSMKNFGSWEEVRLTELLQSHVIVTEFPLMQIPFYHTAKKDEKGISLAQNADLILYGYREVVGSGVRISDPKALAEKAKAFNLPLEDYAPYLKTRDFSHYKETAGFGLGWQRLTHWLLKLPYIWEASHIPRGHHLPRP